MRDGSNCLRTCKSGQNPSAKQVPAREVSRPRPSSACFGRGAKGPERILAYLTNDAVCGALAEGQFRRQHGFPGKMSTERQPPSIDILGEIAQEETIAVGGKIREIERLRKVYGRGRWRKMKGLAVVRLPDGTTTRAEVHWYESHGIGRREFKIKRLLGHPR